MQEADGFGQVFRLRLREFLRNVSTNVRVDDHMHHVNTV